MSGDGWFQRQEARSRRRGGLGHVRPSTARAALWRGIRVTGAARQP